MLDPAVRQIRKVAPSLLADIKSLAASARRVMRKARFWKWAKTEIRPEEGGYKLLYWGTEERKDAALLVLRRKPIAPALKNATVTISELPLRRSLRVPQYVDMDVPLHASLDQILAGYGEKLRRVVLQQLPHAELVEATTEEEFSFADTAMLRPYAVDRHGPTAAQIPFEQVVRMSHWPYGRLHILRMNGQPVACHLGVHDVRKGRSYWTAVRFGYVEAVFSNPKRLHEVNSTNVFLATKFAKEFGADFYSIGMTPGRPDDGLLHWKRRRGAVINARNCNEWFYVRAPEDASPTFFWGCPLFAMRDGGKHLSLHVGLPNGLDEASLVDRYRQMHFLGIDEVVIHHELSIPRTLLDKAGVLLTEGTGTRVTHCSHAGSAPE